MTAAVSGFPYKRNTSPTPRRPRLATDRPMTEPPRKAMERDFAVFGLYLFAASAVLTLAFVADFMPKNPASMDEIAPPMKAKAVALFINRPRAIATTTRNMASMEYCLFR